jgi:uncharacterized protein YggE
MRIHSRHGALALLATASVAAPGLLGPAAGIATAATTTTAATSPTGTLTVTGNGSVQIAPDLANLTVDIARSATTSRAALSAANTRTDAIARAIHASGVPTSGIQTEAVNVANTSHPVGPKAHRHLRHQFTASESLQITLAAPLAGPVVDAATRAGASSVEGLSFSFSNPDAGVSAANTAAIHDARQQADAAAATLGEVVTGVQSVNLDPGSGSTPEPETLAATSGVAASKSTTTPTTVHPGKETVDASVEIVYTIAPAPAS